MPCAEDRVPVVIGVTGHRDLPPEEVPHIKETLSAQLHRLKRLCPHTELVCLSSLAEGADQLCAALALEMGLGLIVPLPMAREEYEKDFAGEALEGFRRLLSQAKDAFVVPDTEGRGEPSRDYAYRQAGIYVARHCHLLLALWDGKPGTSGCGTAEAVEFKLKRSYRAPDTPLTAPDEGIVFHVPVGRRKAPDAPPAGKPRLMENAPGALRGLLGDTARFNGDAAQRKAGFPAMGAETLKALGNGGEAVNRVYMRADSLALAYRDRHLLSLGLLCVAGALLAAAFLLYDELEEKWFLPAYALLALCAGGLYLTARLKRYHSKYFEYRRFAETLRVQLSLMAAGLPVSAEDLMPWSQRALAPWIREAVNTLPACARPFCPPGTADVKTVWLMDQLQYHQSAYRRNLVRAKRQSALSAAMFTLTAVYSAAVLGMEFLAPAFMGVELAAGFPLRSLMKILLGLIPACTLAVTGYYGKLSIQRNLRDGQRMIALYTEALEAYDNPWIDRPRLLTELAREELAENGGWLTSTSENGAELPI